MTAMHLSKARAASRDRRVGVDFKRVDLKRVALKRVALQLFVASSLAFGAEALAQEPITAVYKAQEFSFHYRTSRQLLACHELQQRVANILLAVGARDDIDVKLRNCDGFVMPEDDSMNPVLGRDDTDPWGQDRWGTSSRFRRPGEDRQQSVHVRVRLMMPVEVTPKILQEIDKDKSRRELVSRVTGNPAAAFNDPVVFAAQRQEVTLSQRTVRLRAEDCELLEQMAQQVFRKLDVKVIRRNASCGPRSETRIPPQLVAEALLPTGQLVPMPAPEKPAASDKSAPQPTEPAAETPPQPQ